MSLEMIACDFDTGIHEFEIFHNGRRALVDSINVVGHLQHLFRRLR